MLRRIFGPKGEDIMKRRRKLHNKELRDLISLPSKIRLIKSRRYDGQVRQQEWGEG
jgi:hypothetical protein